MKKKLHFIGINLGENKCKKKVNKFKFYRKQVCQHSSLKMGGYFFHEIKDTLNGRMYSPYWNNIGFALSI